MKRNHDRAPNKKGFSVALPKDLLTALEEIAESESRSRNGQIEFFLKVAIEAYQRKKTTITTNPVTQGRNGTDG